MNNQEFVEYFGAQHECRSSAHGNNFDTSPYCLINGGFLYIPTDILYSYDPEDERFTHETKVEEGETLRFIEALPIGAEVMVQKNRDGKYQKFTKAADQTWSAA